ncbi:OmpH family outer membrane protein [Photobacterium sp. WH77]|uniref:Chaperone protein skp n=1 Tax=Photobacterium arenosum TaxID=2774143 RepID=A0ABR9BR05_9GAMM|nr:MULTISPECIES: OmpH family outer membrane protein [Photobacterium]MBD8514995.1 OmpH family outer membrane protein [Photobacterium arenosum]MBV7263719.1 OmpH family outer membrane protein [Photobacterium sp. WH24]MCG2838800.1 OmpH family outer membrane protein [Photobacterium sp. WH77]MCG2846417.1 OmpH family outer membrane protein [Photobacterium sp. WH80]MDO6582751.1 OmpH family outer membrane protein [Photobacterium sp. 2_MG-2023]
MKQWIKAAGLSLVVLSSSMYTQAAAAAEKVGYVATAQAMAQLAQRYNLQDKLRNEFQGRVTELRSLETNIKSKLEKLKRDGQLMSASDKSKLQNELQTLDGQFKQKARALQEDQARRASEEQQKLAMKLRTAIQDVAKREGYDMVVDGQAILFANPKDDLSAKVMSAVK